MSESESVAIQEQLEYYRARAREYDQWWLREGRYDRGSDANARWFAESEQVRSALAEFSPTGRILELACGTGIWSKELFPTASELTLVDGSHEMLELAQHRLQSASTRYIKADLFDWSFDEEFDVVFFSFWLSHIPPTRFESFWALVASLLAPRGRIFFVDSLHEQTSTATDHRLPSVEATTLRRRLNGGREFQIYKIYYDVHGLEDRLSELAWDVKVAATGSYFLYGQGHRKSA